MVRLEIRVEQIIEILCRLKESQNDSCDVSVNAPVDERWTRTLFLLSCLLTKTFINTIFLKENSTRCIIETETADDRFNPQPETLPHN
jgi:hypothetical protein